MKPENFKIMTMVVAAALAMGIQAFSLGLVAVGMPKQYAAIGFLFSLVAGSIAGVTMIRDLFKRF